MTLIQLKNLQKVLKDYLRIKAVQEVSDFDERGVAKNLLNWVEEELLKQ